MPRPLLADRSRTALATAEDLLRRLEQVHLPVEATAFLELLNDLLLVLANLDSEGNLLSQVHPAHAVRETSEELMRQAQQIRTRLMQSRHIYAALGTLDQARVEAADRLAWRAATLTKQDMRRAGVELSDTQRARVRHLRDELVELEQAFLRNIRDDVRHIQLSGPDEMDGLPMDYVASHPPAQDGRIRVSTEYPDYYPFMNYATSERARMALVQEFYNRAAPANVDVLHQILLRRHELASQLGYASWADYTTEDKMVGSARNVADFLDRVEAAARASVQAEVGALLEFKRRDHPTAQSIGLWESLYYQQRVRSEQFAFDARAARPYFEYTAVQHAILDLNSELFGLEFTPVVDADIWHPSVQTFEVTMDGAAVGKISLDMHPRPGKYNHAACFHWRRGTSGRQAPHVVLVCNFPDPAAQNGPSLMDHQEVVVFFHEFGHLVHGLARGNVRWLRIGQPSERDFMEAPSQLLEEWIYDFDVLRRFARNVETGEPIPEDLVNNLKAARDFGRALYAQWLLFRSMISLRLHTGDPHDMDTTQLVFELAERYLPYELPPDTYYEASFDHLTSYSAAYYTYLWSQAIARDLLSEFKNGLLDVAQTRRYRDLVLAPGGTKPAAELISDFLGRPYTFDALARWLAARP